MRLRNLFMILLLCMTVGMFGVSCTGDDGAQGPPGPKGDTGEPGEVTEADIPEDTDFYPFLESWGVKDGEVGCNDDVLKGMGPLPGPAMALPKPTTATVAMDSVPVEVNCGTGFADVPNNVTTPPLTIDSDDLTVDDNNDIVLVKTGRFTATDADKEVEYTEPTSFNPPLRTTTTKNFMEGLIFANLEDDGTGESLERELLYSDCGGGTAPPSIKGIWRAAQITEEMQEFKDGKSVDDDPDTDTTTEGLTTKTTTKVCVQLDSHPGATKCYVQVQAAKNEAYIALYDGEKLEPRLKVGNPATADLDIAASTVNTDALDFFGDGDITGGDNLCYLFGLE